MSSSNQVNGKAVLMYPSVAARSEIGLNLALPLSLSLCAIFTETIAKNIKNYISTYFSSTCLHLVLFNAMSNNSLPVLVL